MKKANSDSEDGVLHIFDINEMQVWIVCKTQISIRREDKYTNKEEIKCKIVG